MRKLISTILLFVALAGSSQCVISIDSTGEKILIINTGTQIFMDALTSSHPLWDVDLDSIGFTEKQLLKQLYGCDVPITSSVGTIAKVRSLITAAQNALEARAKLSGALFTGAFGYANGMGALVTQLTSKSTAVTINNMVGKITTHTSAMAIGTRVTFTVNNSLVTSTDFVHVGISGVVGQPDGRNYDVTRTSTSNGSFTITIANVSGVLLSQAIQIDFIVIKGNG